MFCIFFCVLLCFMLVVLVVCIWSPRKMCRVLYFLLRSVMFYVSCRGGLYLVALQDMPCFCIFCFVLLCFMLVVVVVCCFGSFLDGSIFTRLSCDGFPVPR